MHRDFGRVNTINKLKRSNRLFKNLVGNLVLDQIEPHHAYELANAQLVNNPDVALKKPFRITIGGVRNILSIS